ncbi:hypothetical protein Hanom_Chr11g01019801 [Helianthus anomalus]
MEGPIFAGGVKEGLQNFHYDSIENREVSNNNGDSVVTNKETEVYFGVPFVENNAFRNKGKYSYKKDCKRLKKGGRRHVGHTLDKMISVDNRPSSRKRPRLEVDPNGLDPFGLDVLLGLANNSMHKGPNVVKETCHVGGTQSNGDVSVPDIDTLVQEQDIDSDQPFGQQKSNDGAGIDLQLGSGNRREQAVETGVGWVISRIW